MLKIIIPAFILLLSIEIVGQTKIIGSFASQNYSISNSHKLSSQLGLRTYYHGGGGTDYYLQTGYSFSENIALNGEIIIPIFQYTDDEAIVSISGKYNFSSNFAIGPFYNIGNNRAGIFGGYANRFEGFLFEVKGGIDFIYSDYFFTLNSAKNLSENFGIMADLYISDGKIQSNLKNQLFLISLGVDYKIFRMAKIFCSIGAEFAERNERIIQLGINYNFL